MQDEQIPIFLINLDRSKVRLQRMIERLEKLGLTFERIQAIEGERPLSLRLSRYVMRSYFKAKRFYFAVTTFGVKPLLTNMR